MILCLLNNYLHYPSSQILKTGVHKFMVHKFMNF